MFKKSLLLSLIFVLVCSISSFAYYTYTQQSGENYFVAFPDKADAEEDTIEVRMILDALGNLLGHSKYNTNYPKDGDITVGYLGRLNYGTDTSKPAIPVVNDMYLATDTVKVYRCFVAANWVQVYPSTIENNVTKTGAFTAGKIAKINNATGIIEEGTNSDTDVADAVTKKHSQNTDTQFDFYNALSSDHTWSGDKDTQPVGEAVVFGDLLYPDWTAGEWLKADADLAAKMPGLRIALESKTDGQPCLMLIKGYVRDDSAFEFTASMVYASVTPGAMSSTAPTETGDQIQRVGVAKSADILFFSPGAGNVGEI